MEKLLCFVFLFLSNLGPISSQNFRLKRDVLPTSYSLRLVPDIDGDTFQGEVTILLKNEKPIRNITLNYDSLVINNVTLDQAYGSTKYVLDPSNEIIQVYFGETNIIDPGEHILHIMYNGSFNQNNLGFFKEKHRDNETRVFLATKFSPNHARAAFPCFDEPFFKSTFSIRLVKPNDSWEAISNMKEIGRIQTSNGIAVDFQSTFRMSTYLLAWVITDYKYVETEYISGERNVFLRFFDANENTQDLRGALKITKKALIFFENYTNVLYPLPKLDSIAMPRYRSSGMENYGLIAYNDLALFKPSPLISKLHYTIESYLLICHEVSHMWFGNLVTHEWYNDLWLTEGFARFVQYKAGAAILGEPFVKDIFQKNKYLPLFQRKCYDEVQTVNYPTKLHEIGMTFGSATYDQGGAVLLMLEDLIGEERLRNVFRDHLNQNRFGTSTTGDFINLLDAAEPKLNIRGLMETFLFQSGLPLVNVTIEKDHYILKQFPLCNDNRSSIFRQKWSFPIRYIRSSDLKSETVWIDREEEEVKIPKQKNDKWILLNHLNRGLYRVVYSREIYESIAADIQKLHRADVGPLIEEAFFMSTQEMLDCDIPLKLLGGLKKIQNIDFLTFVYASRSLRMYSRILDNDPDSEKNLRAYFFDIFEDLYKRVTWTVKQKDSLDTRLLRIAVLESMCLNAPKYKKCKSDAEFLKSSNATVHADVKYIYKGVLNDSKKLNSTMIREVMGQPDPSLDERQLNCISWIRKNLGKDAENINEINL